MRFLLCCFILIPFTGFSQENKKEALKTSMEQGNALYKRHCSVCHKKDGSGKGSRIPPLAQSDFLLNQINASIRGIKYGQKGEIIVNGVLYDKEMKPQKLNDKEIADVMNYILNSWGNTTDSLITTKKVAKVLSE